ncbi:MAG: N-acetylmuramoyl-L-alanine amidase [Myxococcales bacterium]|nr:MAG: N-acetylmuramoyl-L-alanine amidase [Myxococcales bacterium]
MHLNALPNPEEGGIATFVLDTSDDKHALRLAARENGVDESKVSGLQTVLASLQRQGQMPKSERLAALIHRGLLASARQHYPTVEDRGIRRALFFVLAGVHVPSVLVEASFMTNPTEAQLLKTRRYRQLLAEGVAEGMLSYLSENE